MSLISNTDDRLQMEGFFINGTYAFPKRELYEILGNLPICMYSHVLFSLACTCMSFSPACIYM